MPRPPKYASSKDRVRSSITVDGGGCWIWQRHVDALGYGRLTIQVAGAPQTVLAHRFSYEAHVGPIPPALQMDHLCRVRRCVNPAHLEPVTARTNIHRSPIAPAALNARKTRCPKGHPYDQGNTYYQRNGGRLCRTCQRTRPRSSAVA